MSIVVTCRAQTFFNRNVIVICVVDDLFRAFGIQIAVDAHMYVNPISGASLTSSGSGWLRGEDQVRGSGVGRGGGWADGWMGGGIVPYCGLTVV